jgi:hypothetical protein
MSLHFQPAAARLPASFADPALIGANDARTWLVPSQRHCAHAAWKKAGYGALKARAPSLLRPRDNAYFARLSVCGLVASEEMTPNHPIHCDARKHAVHLRARYAADITRYKPIHQADAWR